MKKFRLTRESIEFAGLTLHRIKAMVDFGCVKAGDLGGWVEKEENLSQDDNSWVCDNAWVTGNAWVYGNARVGDYARVCGNARVYGDAWVGGTARVRDNTWVADHAWVGGNVQIVGNAEVCGNADYVTVKGFGSVYRDTTFFRLKSGGVGVVCGCFHGTLAEFRAKVLDTYPDDKRGKEYLMLADLIEYRFGNGGEVT